MALGFWYNHKREQKKETGMKVDAEVKVIADNPIGELKPGDIVTVPIDMDYVSDYDDVIQSIEAELYKRHGAVTCVGVGVKVLNADELLSELGLG